MRTAPGDAAKPTLGRTRQPPAQPTALRRAAPAAVPGPGPPLPAHAAAPLRDPDAPPGRRRSPAHPALQSSRERDVMGTALKGPAPRRAGSGGGVTGACGGQERVPDRPRLPPAPDERGPCPTPAPPLSYPGRPTGQWHPRRGEAKTPHLGAGAGREGTPSWWGQTRPRQGPRGCGSLEVGGPGVALVAPCGSDGPGRVPPAAPAESGHGGTAPAPPSPGSATQGEAEPAGSPGSRLSCPRCSPAGGGGVSGDNGVTAGPSAQPLRGHAAARPHGPSALGQLPLPTPGHRHGGTRPEH